MSLSTPAREQDSPLSAYLVSQTEFRAPDSTPSSKRHNGAKSIPHFRTFSESTEKRQGSAKDPESPVTLAGRLTKAQEKIKTLTELIQTQLQPEIEALRRENHALKDKPSSSSGKHPSRLSVSNQTDDKDKSGDLVHVIDHLEKRFFQSESILKKSVETLKMQLDQERRAKAKLQKELDNLVRDLDSGIHHMELNKQENTEVQAKEAKAEALLHIEMEQIRASYQQELDARLKAQELTLKEQHAREMAQMYENYDLERQKFGSKLNPSSELKKCSEALGQLQYQNRFLLQLLEEKGTLVRTLTALLEQERTRSQATTFANAEIEQLKSAIHVLLKEKSKEQGSTLEQRNASLASKLAKTEKKMRETQRFYAAELAQINRMLNGLKSSREA